MGPYFSAWTARAPGTARNDTLLGIPAVQAMRVRGHTAKADEALSLLSFHRHASLRIKGYTQAGNVPLLIETRLSGAALV